MSELRDSWVCTGENHRAGLCVPRGDALGLVTCPVGHPYEFDGPCSCSPDHPDYRPADEPGVAR